MLKELASKNRDKLFRTDINGWAPLHEASRSGYPDVVEYLIEQGELLGSGEDVCSCSCVLIVARCFL